jgi:FkbM family methyltransferase
MTITLGRREASSDARLRSLADLAALGSAASLRDALAGRYPAFAGPLCEIAILGTADEGHRLAAICCDRGIRVAALVDDDPAKLGTVVSGVTVRPTGRLGELDRATPIVIASHRVLKAAKRLQAMGFAHIAPFALLQILAPESFPPHMFYAGWLEDLAENSGRYVDLADSLADDRSRQVLNAVLGYRLCLDPLLLEAVIDWELYNSPGLLRYGTDEVYIDAGAYDGDSVRLFIERVGGSYQRVIAFEPDPATFARLSAGFAHDPRVEPINSGLHRCGGTLRFDNAASRGSLLTESGGVEVPVVALDEVLRGERASFIKMNIEGAELDALEGARSTIARWSPRLAISAYHRPADLWRVPQAALELNPDYRLYLRQHDGGVIETVLYALPPE